VKRVLPVFFIGGAFVGVVEVPGHRGVGTPIPFWLMLPGILAGALAPDSGFNPEGDIHPWGPISTLINYAVNIVIYGGLTSFFLTVLGRLRRTSK